MTPRRRDGFTLVELMVVIGVIGILTSLLLPALGLAKEKAKSIQCAGNLKQRGMAFMMYAADFDGNLPPYCYVGGASDYYTNLLANGQYLPVPVWDNKSWGIPKHSGVWGCPSGRGSFGYGVLTAISGGHWGFKPWTIAPYIPFSRIRRPAALILAADSCNSGVESDFTGSYQPWDIGFWCPLDVGGSYIASGNNHVSNRHSNGANITFADGHVNWLGFRAIQSNADDLFGHYNL